MKIIECHIKDLLILEPTVFKDKRGHFFESYNHKNFQELVDENVVFVQDNESFSTHGILRGIHYQKPPFDQAKLVRVISGEVLDVVVDLRSESPSFGEYFSIVLSSENKNQLYIPSGFGHGFITLSQSTIFAYKVNQYYAPSYDSGIKWNDTELNINWRLNDDQIIVSDKDKDLPTFKEYCKHPCF